MAACVDDESTTTVGVDNAPDVEEISDGDVVEDTAGPTTATGSAGGGTGGSSGGIPNANGLLDRATPTPTAGGTEKSEKSPGWLNSENRWMAAGPRGSALL